MSSEAAPAAPEDQAEAEPTVSDLISKIKHRQQQGLKPSGSDVVAYARYLGMDPAVDRDLLWIAKEALAAPLPVDWSEHFDSNNRVFYYNTVTRASSWTHPFEDTYTETYKTIIDFRNSALSPQERADYLALLQSEIKRLMLDVRSEVTKWSEHTDEQGKRFYFNRESTHSTWVDPRPAICQPLYLYMKILRLLQSGGSKSSKGSLDWDHSSAYSCREDGHRARSKKSKNIQNHGMERLAPIDLTPTQRLSNSQSEPSIGSLSYRSAVSSCSYLTAASSNSSKSLRYPAFSSFAPSDALSKVGRARVKSGVCLEPLPPLIKSKQQPVGSTSEDLASSFLD